MVDPRAQELGSLTSLSPPLTSKLSDEKGLAKRVGRKQLRGSEPSGYLVPWPYDTPTFLGLHYTAEYHFLMTASKR